MRRTSPVVSESCVTLFQIRIMKKMHSSLLQKHIKWSFSLPHGSHFGGIWERCIRTVRKILHALLQEQIADDQRLVTFMCEVESIMNSRPITPVSSDPNNMEPLTPNHLLLLKSEVTLPPSLFKKEDLFSSCTWKQVQYLADIFWRRWSRKYLPLLELRQKWVSRRRNLAIGDVVLVATESSQKNSWLLGRIVETFLDGRGFVGQVKVRTRTAVFESPVDKLCLLIEGDCSIKGNMDNNSHRHLTDIRLDLSQLTYFVTVLFCKRFALELSLKGQDIVSKALKNNLAVNQLP